MLGFTPIKFLPSLRHWSGSCQGHCWPSFCKIKCFFTQSSTYLMIYYSQSLSFSWNILLSSLGFWNKPLSWFFHYLTGFSFQNSSVISSHSQQKPRSLQWPIRHCFSSSLFSVLQILFYNSFCHFLHSCHFLCTGQVCSYLRVFALATPPPRMCTWISPLLPPGFYSSYTMSVSFQLSLCSLFYLSFFFRVCHHLTYYTFTFKLAIIYLCQ